MPDDLDFTENTCDVDHDQLTTIITFPDGSQVTKQWDTDPDENSIDAFVSEEMNKKFGS